MSSEEQFDLLNDRIQTMKNNFWSTCAIVTLLFFMLCLFCFGSYIYIWLHGHDEFSDLEKRIEALNLTGLDDFDAEGLCTLMEENIEIDCLKDVIGAGANDGDILTYDTGGPNWMPMHPDDICPASCINGTDGATGPPGSDGVDGINGTDGIHCWDLNGNGACDLAEEDLNDDGECNVTDCVPFVVNGTEGLQGPEGPEGPEGPPGPIVPVCNFTDVDCSLGPEDCSVLKYVNATSTWDSVLLSFDDLSGDACPALGTSSIDCLGDVETPSPSTDSFLQYNGSVWKPGSVDFEGFVTDVCVGTIDNLTLDCLDGVDVGGASEGDILRFDGTLWTDAEISYDDLGGSAEGSGAMKGIGGGVHFSSLSDQTQILNPTVLGTLNFTDGEAYRVSATLDDLNGKVVIPYVGKTPGEYLFEAFYYHAGSPNVVVSIYEYTTAQMNSGSAAGTLIGSFTTEAAPGYAVTLFAVNATASPAVWIPQTTSDDVYLKALL
jgi:hypothetical protein